MIIQIHLALLWTRTVWFETKPLDQRGASPRNNNTDIRKPREWAYASPIDKQGNSVDRKGRAQMAATMVYKHDVIDQVHVGKIDKAEPRRSGAAAPARRTTRGRRAPGTRPSTPSRLRFARSSSWRAWDCMASRGPAGS